MGQTVLNVMLPLWTIFGPAALLWLLWLGIAELQRRGYSTSYLAALVRAMGAGMEKARSMGLDPFSVAGRLVVAEAGTKYIMDQVSGYAAKLNIPEAEHGAKVLAQMDAMQEQAMATAKASESTSVAKALVMLANPVVKIDGQVSTTTLREVFDPKNIQADKPVVQDIPQ